MREADTQPQVSEVEGAIQLATRNGQLTKDKRQMKLKPLADRVIVRQSEAENKTASGIVLPDTAKEKPTKGKVVAVGPGKFDDKGKRMELGVRAGDTVYYGKYSGTDVEVEGEKFVILRESDILGILE